MFTLACYLRIKIEKKLIYSICAVTHFRHIMFKCALNVPKHVNHACACTCTEHGPVGDYAGDRG